MSILSGPRRAADSLAADPSTAAIAGVLVGPTSKSDDTLEKTTRLTRGTIVEMAPRYLKGASIVKLAWSSRKRSVFSG
ncbi:transcription factor MafB-like [Iris pallida]|uniref:Transcription factor MafB-like n=1 Tax=Iris pallida TaxID=29817 RepID=A0AAX6IEG8_IRIPA|nr:transcription factor MafB-like [Iris pallida]